MDRCPRCSACADPNNGGHFDAHERHCSRCRISFVTVAELKARLSDVPDTALVCEYDGSADVVFYEGAAQKETAHRTADGRVIWEEDRREAHGDILETMEVFCL